MLRGRLTNAILITAAPALLIFAAALQPTGVITKILTVFLFLFFAQKNGAKLVGQSDPVKHWIIGSLSLLSATVLLQTSMYYLNIGLNGFTDAISVAGSIWMVSALTRLTGALPPADIQENDTADSKRLIWFFALLIPALIAFGYVMKGAVAGGTVASIRTPWPLLPEGTFLALAILPVAAWLAAKKTASVAMTGIFSALSLLAVTLIAPFVYRLGYGFDGFLHRASQTVLFETGTLNPKPLYYIGQYTLNTWLSRLFELSITEIDRFLVPVGIVILIASAYAAFRASSERAFAMAAMAPLLILSPFVATTPQAFSYLIGLSALILAFGSDKANIHAGAPLLLALWCLAIHPLAGLPFIGAVAAVLWSAKLRGMGKSPLKSPVVYVIALLTAASVPMAFLFFSGDTGRITWDFSKWLSGLSALWIFTAMPENHVTLWADWSNYAAFMLPVVLWALALFSVIREREDRSLLFPILITAAGAWLAGRFLSAVGEFTFLINYERGNYSERLTQVSYLLLVLPAILGFGKLSKQMLKRGPLAAGLFLLCVSAWHAGHVYNALPRHDAAAASRGWSVGEYDFDAVRFIEQNAAGEPYTVLANQSVSATAVQTYGFRRYVKDAKTGEDIFYYPIPTGGTLYRLYLEAVSPNPDLQAVRDAAYLGQSDNVYVVLNEYWWDAERVAAVLEAAADQTASFGDGAVRVFRFSVQR